MKKKVSDFVKSLGGTTGYSGKRKTMFIHGSPKVRSEHLQMAVIKMFGYELPFKLS